MRPEVALALGALLLGVALGVVLARWASGWVHRARWHGGRCGLCGREGHLVRCRLCGREAAMCHYWGILFPDDPEPDLFRRRRAVEVCVECMPWRTKRDLDDLSARWGGKAT